MSRVALLALLLLAIPEPAEAIGPRECHARRMVQVGKMVRKELRCVSRAIRGFGRGAAPEELAAELEDCLADAEDRLFTKYESLDQRLLPLFGESCTGNGLARSVELAEDVAFAFLEDVGSWIASPTVPEPPATPEELRIWRKRLNALGRYAKQVLVAHAKAILETDPQLFLDRQAEEKDKLEARWEAIGTPQFGTEWWAPAARLGSAMNGFYSAATGAPGERDYWSSVGFGIQLLNFVREPWLLLGFEVLAPSQR